MGSVGATLLARGLAANRSLTYLNLSSNRIDDDGLTALCDAIKVQGCLLCRRAVLLILTSCLDAVLRGFR